MHVKGGKPHISIVVTGTVQTLLLIRFDIRGGAREGGGFWVPVNIVQHRAMWGEG